MTTSARTSTEAADALAAAITVPHYIHHWEKGQAGNPFLGFLGLSERIIVTADSISMLAEACATGKPVSLFDIEQGPQAMRADESRPMMQAVMPSIHWRGRNLSTTFFRLLMNMAPVRWSRDLRIVHHRLIASGLASWLGEEALQAVHHKPQLALERSTAHIRQLFGL